MEALLVDRIPAGGEWQYEPKRDGFRCIAFKDGTQIELQSKNCQSLRRSVKDWFFVIAVIGVLLLLLIGSLVGIIFLIKRVAAVV
jgi:ATP-dependent DNA ligase